MSKKQHMITSTFSENIYLETNLMLLKAISLQAAKFLTPAPQLRSLPQAAHAKPVATQPGVRTLASGVPGMPPRVDRAQRNSLKFFRVIANITAI